MAYLEQQANYVELGQMLSKIRENEKDMVHTVKYGILTEEEIGMISSFDITLNLIRQSYKPTYKGVGIQFIDDNPYLGVREKDKICPTCHLNGYNCNGHFGNIELPIRAINYFFIKTVCQILNCVCFVCARIKTDRLEPNKLINLKKIPLSDRLEYLSTECKKYTWCQLCNIKYSRLYNAILTKIQETNDKASFGYSISIDEAKINEEYSGKKNKTPILVSNGKNGFFSGFLNYDVLHNILSRIRPEDYKILGIGENKPQSFIMDKLLLLPPIARPEYEDGTQLFLDPLSKSYGKILDKIYHFIKDENQNIYDFKWARILLDEVDIDDDMDDDRDYMLRVMNASQYSPEMRRSLERSLLTHVNITNSQILNMYKELFVDYTDYTSVIKYYKSIENFYNLMPPDPNTVEEKGNSSIQSKLNGKFGFLRRYMMGKRVNYTGRTVVGPSPDFKVNEIGVPKFIAENMPVRVTVTSVNYNEILDLYKNNKIIGIIKKVNQNEVRYDVTKDKPFKIKIGDQVERKLQDGDYVIANRNPTIHKYNMLGLRVKVIPENIFRLNLALTGPYNADFDGDEMNIHVPQTVQAQSELKTFASAEECYPDVTSSKLMAGMVFDAITGTYILTQDWTFLEVEMFEDIIGNCGFPEDYLNNYKNYYHYGFESFNNKKVKLTKCLDIVYGQLVVHVPLLVDYKDQIRTTIEDFQDRVFRISSDNFVNDYDNEFYENPQGSTIQSMIEKVVNESYNVDSMRFLIIFKLNSIVQKIFNTTQDDTQLLSQNERIYARLFIEKLGYYYYLINKIGLDYEDPNDSKDSFYDQCINNNIDFFSGKALFSIILPTKFSYEKYKKVDIDASDDMSDIEKLRIGLEKYNNTVKIKNGILYQGILTKDHVGATSNSIGQALSLYENYDSVTFFLTFGQRLINYWFFKIGFTLSLKDCSLNKEKADEIEEELLKIRAEAYNLQNIETLYEEEKEEKIIMKLSETRILNKKVIQNMNITNPFLIMAELAKSKGKGANLVQVVASVGQQYYGGKRIPNDLVYFKRDDPDPSSKGFISSSFVKGMTPSEFVFHMYSSREGIVDSQMKVGMCGHLKFQMTKAMEILNVNEDRSIRTKLNRVVQFVYGEDGLDNGEVSKIKVNDYQYSTFIDVKFIANQYNNTVGSTDYDFDYMKYNLY